MKVLVIGGAGYIGSHTITELVAAGYKPVILDNFETSHKKVLGMLNRVTGMEIPCIEGDFTDEELLRKTLDDYDIEGVIHFAAHKAVGESVQKPLKYYKNNVAGFITLVKVLSRRDIPLVFSSSAAVYGNPPVETVGEETVCVPTSPYGWTKLMDEVILRDTCTAQKARGIALRYFNVVGAHDSGELGEMPKLPPQNVLPIIVEAVARITGPMTVFGNNYETPDGTCLRDYIHVVDLARAHVSALNHLLKQPVGYYDDFNVGTGEPTSVMDLITTFERVNKVEVPYKIGVRRPGDPRACWANTEKIQSVLGWHAEKTTEDAVRSAWQWHQRYAS